MNLAKKLLPLVTLGIFLISKPLCAETLFGPGTILIGTNETILLTTVDSHGSLGSLGFYLDGNDVSITTGPGAENLPIAITGPHSLFLTNDSRYLDFYATFQRITNSSIKTLVTLTNITNFINVPSGKTIQFFPPLGCIGGITAQPQDSSNSFHVWFWAYHPPSITGPVTIQVSFDTNGYGGFYYPTVLSYYFTDDVLQFPATGLLSVPAPILEVNIQKSYDLQTWLPSATFHTEAETGAFYRLQMLK